MPFKIERYSPAVSERGADLALLHTGRTNLPVLQLGDSDAVRIGDSVWSIGYPEVASSTDEVIGGWLSRESDLEATLSNGTITAIKTDITNTPVFQSNVGIYRGNSGGPAVNREDKVIGISTWGHTDAEQIKFLVPINVAKSFVTAAHVAFNSGGEFNQHWQKALTAAADGNWNLANGELTRVSALFPSSPDLVRFRHDIDRALQSMPMWRRHPVATGAVGVAAIGVLAALFIPIAVSWRPRIPKDALSAKTVVTMISPSGEHSVRLLGRFTILNGSRAGAGHRAGDSDCASEPIRRQHNRRPPRRPARAPPPHARATAPNARCAATRDHSAGAAAADGAHRRRAEDQHRFGRADAVRRRLARWSQRRGARRVVSGASRPKRTRARPAVGHRGQR